MENSSKSRESPILRAFQEHRGILAAYLAQRLLRAEDVEDILQETFVQAYRREEKTDVRSPKAYLFTIARNLLSKQFEAQSKALFSELDEAQMATLPSSDPSMEDQVYYGMKMQIFVRSVRMLPPQCRKVFLLRKVYGWPHKKISSKLGISKSTVERHITNALTRLSTVVRVEEDLGLNQSRPVRPTGQEVKHD